MKLIVKQTQNLNGKVTPPSSKSQSIRALMLASLCEGESILKNILHSDDTNDALTVCKALGANIIESNHSLTLCGNGLPLNNVMNEIHSGNSGISTHFVMPILGLRKNSHQPVILNCSEQMRNRPVKSLVDALKQLGLEINYLNNPDTLPISISGELTGGYAEVSGVTSQYLSALLMALPCAAKDSEIRVKNLMERPYVEMTLNWLKNQNIKYQHSLSGDVDIYQIKGKQQYKNFSAEIAGDFSSASCIITAATLMQGEVILQGLDMNDVQGDKRLVSILQEMGAEIVCRENTLTIHGGKKLSGIKIDASNIPDLLPALAVIGTCASGKTEIVNVSHARIKETDRIHSMTEELSRMNAKISAHADGLIIYQSQLHGANVKGYGDHRTVMALSVAGLMADGTTTIHGSEAIAKTFPSFVEIMQSIGANMEVQHASAA